MTKTEKIVATLAIAFWVIFNSFIVWYVINLIQFIPSFVRLNIIVDEWEDYLDVNFTEKVPMETTKNIIDAESWEIIYKFPMRPFARYTVHFIGDMDKSELEKLALEAARNADENFGGRETKVDILAIEEDDGTFLYRVIFLKRCVSLSRVW